MSEDLAVESPKIFPSPIVIPSDSDPPLASGYLRTALKALADRTDFLGGSPNIISFNDLLFETNATIDSLVAPTGTPADVDDTSQVVAVEIGDIVAIEVDLELSSAGSNDVECWVAQDGVQLGETVRVTDGKIRTSIITRRTMAAAGGVIFNLRMLPDGADDVIIKGPGAIRITVMRPLVP